MVDLKIVTTLGTNMFFDVMFGIHACVDMFPVNWNSEVIGGHLRFLDLACFEIGKVRRKTRSIMC